MGGWFVIHHDSMIAHHNIKLYRLQMLINSHNLRYFIFFWLFLIDFIHGYYYFAFLIVIILHHMMAYYHYMTDIIILLCTGIICIYLYHILLLHITTYSSLLYYQESIDMIRFSSSLSVFQVALRMTCTISMLRRRLRLPVSLGCLCGSRAPSDNCGTVLGIMMV